jgi:hypothetical protein
MKSLILIIILFLSQQVYADCRGCCSGHGGILCLSAKTQCRDGSLLSKKCAAKGCNKCSSEKASSSYERSSFSGWIDEDRDCLDTRHEILKKRSLRAVTISKLKSGRCKILTGQWADYYYDEVLMEASKIDIDHLVPLKHAYDSGAANWHESKRDQFALDPENLVITNLSYNRIKGSKTILEWMPINRAYACRYTEQWFYIKKKYNLEISSRERDYKDQLKCEKIKRLPAKYIGTLN